MMTEMNTQLRNNSKKFLEAANWALVKERFGEDTGVNIRRASIDNVQNVTLFNGSKGLLFDGYSFPEQEHLKGLIVQEVLGSAHSVLATCFPKFYNYGEPAEKQKHLEYLNDNSIRVLFAKKEDGVNIRPYFNLATNRVEFATRGTLLGVSDIEETSNLDYGAMARSIAEEKYPILLDEEFVKKYSCIFEMIHPDSKILTDYGQRKDLILLSVFDLENNCYEFPREWVVSWANTVGLNYVEYWFDQYAPVSEFSSLVGKLLEKWNETDVEGSVVVFVNSELEPVYRLKVKNAYYLQMLRLAKFCTLKNLVSIMEENNFSKWEQLRAYLYESPSMNEELEMAYKAHFDVYENWLANLEIQKQNVLKEYQQLPFFELQKDFALYILKDGPYPYNPLFFAIRKWLAEAKNPNLGQFFEENVKAIAMLKKIYPLSEAEE